MTDYPLQERFRRALVTGGAGFIGSHLVGALLADGLEVISVDDYSAGKAENLDAWRDNPALRIERADVTDVAALTPLLQGVDVVFHNAASKNTICMAFPARDLAVNGGGTLNMLTAARQAGVRKFVHASTGSVYGDAHYFPTDEEHPTLPNSYYGVSKLAGERYARVFHHLYGLDVTVLRYYHVFGPRQDNSDVGGVVSIFGRHALRGEPIIIYGDGTQLRSFTYVEDVVRINKLAALEGRMTGQAYNCASGVKVTIAELARAVIAHLGRPDLPIIFKDWRPGDIKTFDVDNSKLRGLGYAFRWSFADGLAATLDDLRRHLGRA